MSIFFSPTGLHTLKIAFILFIKLQGVPRSLPRIQGEGVGSCETILLPVFAQGPSCRNFWSDMKFWNNTIWLQFGHQGTQCCGSPDLGSVMVSPPPSPQEVTKEPAEGPVADAFDRFKWRQDQPNIRVSYHNCLFSFSPSLF